MTYEYTAHEYTAHVTRHQYTRVPTACRHSAVPAAGARARAGAAGVQREEPRADAHPLSRRLQAVSRLLQLPNEVLELDRHPLSHRHATAIKGRRRKVM